MRYRHLLFFVVALSVGKVAGAATPSNAQVDISRSVTPSPVVPTGKASLIDPLTYEAIIASTAGRVEESLRSQQDLYWSIATAIGAVLVGLIAFLGYGQIKSLREGLADDVIRQLTHSTSFKDEIANQIEESILKSVRDAQTAIERQIDFLNVRKLAEGLESVESFSSVQRDSLFEGLLRLKDDKTIADRPEFLAAVEQVFSSFFQAGLWDKIDALESELRHITIANPNLILSLIPSLGYRILSETNVDADTQSGLLRYIQAAKNLKFPEAALPFELAYLLQIKPDNWERRAEIVLEDAASMTNNDLAVFLDRIARLSDPATIARNPRAYHVRIASKFKAVADTYHAQLEHLANALRTRMEGMDQDEGSSPAAIPNS